MLLWLVLETEANQLLGDLGDVAHLGDVVHLGDVAHLGDAVIQLLEPAVIQLLEPAVIQLLDPLNKREELSQIRSNIRS